MFTSQTNLPVCQRPMSYYTDHSKNSDNGFLNNKNEVSQWRNLLDPIPIANDGVKVVQTIAPSGFLKAHRKDDDFLDLLRPLLLTKQANKEHQQQGMANHLFPSASHGQTSKLYKDIAPTTTLEHAHYLTATQQHVVSSDSSSSSSGSTHTDFMSKDSISGTGYYEGPINQRHQWNLRYDELCLYKDEYGHCSVPYNYEANPSLAQWVRRQRHQKKRKSEGKHSNLSDDREALLDKLGFVWNSHKAGWDGMFQELCEFKEQRGHCNVPTRFPVNQQLAIWVKLQRRQYRLLKKSPETSTMTPERVARLQALGFVWNPRNLKH